MHITGWRFVPCIAPNLQCIIFYFLTTLYLGTVSHNVETPSASRVPPSKQTQLIPGAHHACTPDRGKPLLACAFWPAVLTRTTYYVSVPQHTQGLREFYESCCASFQLRLGRHTYSWRITRSGKLEKPWLYSSAELYKLNMSVSMGNNGLVRSACRV